MPGGRPAAGAQQPHPELEELAAWFRQALADAGYRSVNGFIQRHPFEKNRLYGLFSGLRFVPLESACAIAVALGRGQREVEPIWWRAKAAIDRASADRATNRVIVSTWSDLPWPSPALQDILEAQCYAADVLPYHLLDVEPPPLSTVYVRQQARLKQVPAERDRREQRHEPSEEGSRVGEDSAVPISAALDRHEHLIITGEPGAGKSTLAQYLALVLSRVWLRTVPGMDAPMVEPVVPLRVAARALADASTWSAALAVATRQALGPRLVAEPSSALFERRAQGTRWLVLVDGVDEIVDPEARASVIQALAARCRAHGDYRILITSRELTERELAPLRVQGVGAYTLEPFDRAELTTFAEGWFATQRASDPASDSARFLQQLDDGELRELVRNPLLATLAAIAYTMEPSRPLPIDRLGLYERFFEHLVLRDSAGRGTMAELRRMHAEQPARGESLNLLYQLRVPLLRHLAVVRLEGESSLVEAAHEWLGEQASELDVRWIDVETILRGTGLLVFEAAGARFLHHSFAEFLAAQYHAENAGPEFPELETWISRALRPAEREFAMFVFALWSKLPGNDPGRIFDALLGGHPERIMLAGRILGRTAAAADRDNRRVVDRLSDLALGSEVIAGAALRHDSVSYTGISTTQPSAVLEVLGQLANNHHASKRLKSIACSTGTSMSLRIAAAEAYGKIESRDTAAAWLRRFIPSCRGGDRVQAVRSLLTLDRNDPGAKEHLRCVGEDMAESAKTRAAAASELSALGDDEAATRVADSVMQCRPIEPNALGLAMSTWLACTAGAAERDGTIAAVLAGRRAVERLEVAVALADAGFHEQGGEIAADVLTDPSLPGWRYRSAVKICVDGRGLTDSAIVAILRNCPEAYAVASAARGMGDAGRIEAAVDLARQAINRVDTDGFSVGLAAVAWLSAAGESAMPAVRESIEQQLARYPIRQISFIANELAEAGHQDIAVEYARSVIISPIREDWDLFQAVQAWFTATGPAAAPQIRTALYDSQRMTAAMFAMAAEGAALSGCVPLAIELATDAFTRDVTDNYRFGSATRALCLALGPAAEERLTSALAERPFDAVERLAVSEHLAASGALEAARRRWLEILRSPDASLHHIAIAAVRLVVTTADTHVEALMGSLPTERVESLRAVLAALAIFEPAIIPD